MTAEPPRSLRSSDDVREQWYARLIFEFVQIFGGRQREDTVTTPAVDVLFEMTERGARVFFGQPGAEVFVPLDYEKAPLDLEWTTPPDQAAMRVGEAAGLFQVNS